MKTFATFIGEFISVSWLKSIKFISTQSAICGKGCCIKVDRPISTDICALHGNQAFDCSNHLRHLLGSTRICSCRLDVEAIEISMKSIFKGAGNLKRVHLCLCRLCQHFVFFKVICHMTNIGDVLHQGDIKASHLQSARDQI